jgi:hypothetical protein
MFNFQPIKLKKKPVNGVLKSSQNKMPAKNVKLTDGVPSIEVEQMQTRRSLRVQGTAEETEKAEKIPKRTTRKSANGLDENSESTSDEKPSRRSARKSIKESDEVESTKETRRPTRKSMKSGINDDELIQAPIKRPTRRSTNAPVEAKENGIAPTTTTQTEEHLIQAPTKRSTRKAVSRPVQEEASISLCNNELTEASTEKAIVELTIAHCSATIASAEEKEPPKRVSNRLRSKRPAEQNLPRSLKKRLIVQDDESTKIEIEETSMNGRSLNLLGIL